MCASKKIYKKMINVENKAECCGCTACASICPTEAISMQPDVLGFLYPVVTADKCVNCGLCEKVCAFNDDYSKESNLEQPLAFAVRHKQISEVEHSRSGAVFVAISDYILECGGVVYGAAFTDDFSVVHKRATTKEQRDEFRGSKYVQSNLDGLLLQVKADLKNGIKVLFSGTPCQTAALNSFVGKRLRENLFLVDIVCHGVPAPNVWLDYLSFLESEKGRRIIGVDFRDKQQFGWSAHRETYRYEGCDGKFTVGSSFYNTLYFRESCAECKYTNLQRPSDITIGDFWGWEKTDRNINADNKGVSLVLCNSEKGYKLFSDVKENLIFVPASLGDILQPNLVRPTTLDDAARRIFVNDYSSKGFYYAMSRQGLIGWRLSLKLFVGRTKEFIKRIIFR